MNLSQKTISPQTNFIRTLQIIVIFGAFSFANDNGANDSCIVNSESLNQIWPMEVSLYKVEKTFNILDMKIKPGSQLEGISALWLRLFHEIDRALPNLPITWVSGLEGQSHRNNPEHHYSGKYLDLRIKDWPMVEIYENIVIEGRDLVNEAIDNLNQIKDLEAELIEGELYPFIELRIIENSIFCNS